MHMQGLICFILQSEEFKDNERIHLYKKDFHYFHSFGKDDWGNPSLEYLRQLTLEWEPLMILSTANDNFKIYIKTSEEIIFWLLEWNQYYRVCGFIGENEKCSSVIDSIPEESFKYLGNDIDNGKMYIKQCHPLNENSPDFIFDNKEI